jgi:hypothetical protein
VYMEYIAVVTYTEDACSELLSRSVLPVILDLRPDQRFALRVSR